MLGNKRIMGNNILFYMNKMGIERRDFAKAIGVPYSSLTDWINGNTYPRIDKIERMATFFGIEKSDLVEDKAATRTIKGARIPVLGRVAAGRPIEALENVIDWEEIPEEMAKKGEYFGLVIKGDSMEPRIYEGDVIIVRKQEEAESGQTVVITINGDDATCKRLEKHSGGLSLYSLNPKYTPFTYTAEEAARLPIRIYGVVVEIRGKMKGM